jgi:hypothetical protein
VWYRASNASGYTNNVFAQAALDGAEILGPDTPAGVRLAQTGRFLTYLGEDLLRRAEYWHAVTFGRSQSQATAAWPRVQRPDPDLLLRAFRTLYHPGKQVSSRSAVTTPERTHGQ